MKNITSVLDLVGTLPETAQNRIACFILEETKKHFTEPVFEVFITARPPQDSRGYTSPGGDYIGSIRIVREYSNLSLKDAKAAVDAVEPNKPVFTGNRFKAERLWSELTTNGCKAYFQEKQQ